MPLYRPPSSFTESLTRFDPLLRVRWSDWESRWRIERKITRARWVNPSTYHESCYEDFIAARDGYVPVLFCERNELDERVFVTLWYGDIWRRGGGNGVAHQMETNETLQQQASRARWLREVYDQAKDHFFTMNTLTPTRTSVDRGFA